MNSSRLKNIIIAILALTNAFLLVLLVTRRALESASFGRATRELVQLYEASGVRLDAGRIPGGALRLSPVEPQRDLTAEAAFAEAILGDCAAEDVGGGIYRYANDCGQCLMRSSGAIEATLERQVDDVEAFYESLFSAHGYGALYSTVNGGSGRVGAARMLPGATVFNAELTLVFFAGRLVSVTGSFVPPVEPAELSDGMDGITALVRFLDYSNLSGEVCTEVSDIRGGYLLQSTASASQRLIPVWRITTDVNDYYVNSASGELSRSN
ncbi:MAG: hypothetical protein IKN81_00405 [Oscillospiraceae bacterium]|nr:hypothetical protein [Oscillospiraceae bacterium]